jgi:hypothetical protein
MRTYPLLDANGELYAFEVGNVLIGGATIGRLVRSKLGATITSGPTAVFSSTDVRLGFTFNGARFIAVEPFGDNSRYWVGSESDGLVRHPLIDSVHAVIREYWPLPLAWLRSFTGLRNDA